MIDSSVKTVLLDAVGTIIVPHPPVLDVYFAMGQRCGSYRSPEEILQRFGELFSQQEKMDLTQGHRTDEVRERLRWQSIVHEIFNDLPDPEICFQGLYAHFAQPSAWKSDPALPRVIVHLQERGLQTGVASNFDHRLRQVLVGMTGLDSLAPVVISAEIGWKKPAPEFYEEACRLTGHRPEEILMVGDDPDNDYHAAQTAGLQTLLFDPHNRFPDLNRIASFEELLV